MPSYYVDSSALVKRHVNEIGSPWIQTILNDADQIISTSRISITEVYSALNRRVCDASLSLPTYAAIVTDFDILCINEYGLIELTIPIIHRTRILLEQHPLRAYDAIQLASALLANETLLATHVAPLTFLSADDRLIRAAYSEGLLADNPNHH